jgi:hypothetical protein
MPAQMLERCYIDTGAQDRRTNAELLRWLIVGM